MYQRNELCHYGIKGQEHGNRRYQNPDGTWTEEGKRRRRMEYEGSSKDTSKKPSSKKSTNKIKVLFSKKKGSKKVENTNKVKKTEDNAQTKEKEFNVSNYFDKKTNRTSAKQASKDIGQLTNSQLKEITDRIAAENTLYDQVQKENQRKKSSYRKFMNNMKKAAEDIETVNKFYKSVTANPAFKYAMKEIKGSKTGSSNTQNTNKEIKEKES